MKPHILAVFAVSVAACAAPPSVEMEAAGKPAIEAPAAPKEISVNEAYARTQSGDVLLIDVRSPEEWRETGIAPGAALVNWKDDDFAAQASALIGEDKSRPVALICRTGNRSGQAAQTLADLGFENVVNVTNGMAAPGGWIDSGLPVEAPPEG